MESAGWKPVFGDKAAYNQCRFVVVEVVYNPIDKLVRENHSHECRRKEAKAFISTDYHSHTTSNRPLVMQLLDLPPEILEQILGNLCLQDLFSVRRSHSRLKLTVDDSAHLQYNIALQSSGLQNNASKTCIIPIADRLRLLTQREADWCDPKVKWRHIIDQHSVKWTNHDLVGGTFLLAITQPPDVVPKFVKIIELPSLEQDLTIPKEKVYGVRGQICDIAARVHLDDLLVAATVWVEILFPHSLYRHPLLQNARL